MNLVLVGINHRTAPVEVREKMVIQESRQAAALADLVRREGIREGLILSTCNRTEVAVSTHGSDEPEQSLRQFLADTHRCNLDPYEAHLYWLRQRQVVDHLFRVAASLDSMIVGEAQILGQVKRAALIAREAGALRGELHDVVEHALAVGRRVRRETAIGVAAVSVSTAAVELAKSIFGSLEGKTVFILGSGKMSELAARSLASSGVSDILVSSRTHERALDLAARFHGEAVPFDRIFHHLANTDIAICSTGSPHFMIQKAQVEELLSARKNRPIFFVDLAVPRDVDPAVNDLDNAFVYDIDDLGRVVQNNRKQRNREAAWAEEIVQQETDRMMRRLESIELAPTIVALDERLQSIREAELERFNGRLAGLTPDQRETVNALTQAILNKILHGPVSELKDAAGRPDHGTLVQLVRRLFGVPD
jgi:glutamyl-tRNA reductase